MDPVTPRPSSGSLTVAFWPRRRAPSTLVIGATGGSGTRALSGLFEAAAVFMGKDQNKAGDAMLFEPWLSRFIDRILEQTRSLNFSLDDLPEEWRGKPSRRYRRLFDEYVGDLPRGARIVGIKNPRNMFVIPILADALEDVRLLHVVRDGRDMAFSGNQNQLKRHYAALFGAAPESERDPVASIRLWSKANTEAAAAGRRLLGDRYRAIRLEDLCADPVEHARALLRFVGADESLAGDVATTVHTPSSFGRFHEQDDELVQRVTDAGRDGLRAFGYLS